MCTAWWRVTCHVQTLTTVALFDAHWCKLRKHVLWSGTWPYKQGLVPATLDCHLGQAFTGRNHILCFILCDETAWSPLAPSNCRYPPTDMHFTASAALSYTVVNANVNDVQSIFRLLMSTLVSEVCVNHLIFFSSFIQPSFQCFYKFSKIFSFSLFCTHTHTVAMSKDDNFVEAFIVLLSATSSWDVAAHKHQQQSACFTTWV